MSFSNKDDGDDCVSEINLTPLIDVMLVLLIIFMVSTSVAVDTGLTINIPKGDTTVSTLQKESIILAMDSLQKMSVNGKISTFDTLNDDLKAAILKKNSGVVILKGDKTVSLESIVKIMDIVHKSGATKFALAVEQN